MIETKIQASSAISDKRTDPGAVTRDTGNSWRSESRKEKNGGLDRNRERMEIGQEWKKMEIG